MKKKARRTTSRSRQRRPTTRPARSRSTPKPTRHTRRDRTPDLDAELVSSLVEREIHHEASPILTGGDVDADWQDALSTGEEAVGGSAPTPDQDVVDEIGRALGIEPDIDAQVTVSADILDARDRSYWQLEREAAERDES
jgi:Family of unknown function (DUF6335)